MKLLASLLLFVLISVETFAQNTRHDNNILLDYYQNQRYVDAYNYLQSVYKQPVNDNKVLGMLAYTAQMSGKLPEAERYYLQILEKDSINVPVLFSLGNINIRRNNNAGALGYYKKILLKDSTNFNVYRQLSILSKNSGDIGAAIVYLQKANKINPVDGDVAYDLLNFYLPLKQYQYADTVISTALAADTSNMLLIVGKAKVMYQLKQYNETIALCRRLLNAGDMSYAVISMLGTSCYQLKQYHDCIDAFGLLSNTNTHTEASWYYMGMSYKALKNQPKARECFEHAVKEALSPSIDTYYGEIADSYEKSGKYKLSAAAYQKALQFNERPLTLYMLAVLYEEKIKSAKNAAKYYKRYLSSNPPESHQQYINFAKERLKTLGK